ncbi:VTC domain [seawater metagenome]|uniref:VTC domain n=1 Tax=seawater metagenome TaxID=1561972 RepID=A0A5E8CKI7_9ZZZZ
MRNKELDKVLNEIDGIKRWNQLQNREFLIKKILELNEELDFISKYQEINKIEILTPLLKYFSFYLHPKPVHGIQQLTHQMKRSTLKIIIPKHNIIKVMLEILKHKKLYRVNWEDGNPYQVNKSIYFDNSKFKCYSHRIQKLDNSWVFRFREYEDIRKILMMEFKNHKKYTDSIKERDFISSKDIKNIINGSFKKTIIDYDLLQKHKLKPKILTSYKRFYFQEDENSNLRITMDLDIIGKKVIKYNQNGNFIFDDDQYSFEDAVIEIKFRDCKLEEIDWLQKLVNSDLIDKDISKAKYSKFISTIWYFFGQQNGLIKPKWQ